MLYLFARSMTKGGRGLEGHQGVRRQRSNPDRPLPPDMLQLPAARQRVSRSAHEMFSCMMHFDSRVFRRGVKNVETLSVTSMRYASCERARAKRIARIFVGLVRLSVSLIVSGRMYRATGTRALCAKARMQCLSYTMLDR